MILLALAAPVTASRAAPDDLFAQIFKRGVVRQQTLHSIKARFTETTVSSLLVKPLVAHGTIVAANPARVLMTYTDPEPKTVAIDRKSLLIVWPGRGEREQINIENTQERIDQYFAHASIEQLRSMFAITAMPDPAMRQTDRVEMRPKRKQIREGLERLDLWIDRESVLLVQMRLVFSGGDEKTIRLDDIAVNVPISEGTFHVPN
jgi:outer membrane lipoprotein-sorting protein